MIKAKDKLQNADGIVFCFLASVIIAVIALNLGLNTEPGKIIPAGLSMRSDVMNKNIIKGIDLALEDIELIRSGLGASDIWRYLTFIHLDLFFYLALLVPSAAKTILVAGYYVRFGLCCSAMFYFLSEHIKLGRLASALLAVMYAFSSQIIFTAQFPEMINMAFMLPVVMSAADSYLRRRTWKSYSLLCISSFGLCASGGFGIVSGAPAMILVIFLMCIGLYKTITDIVTSWIKALSGLIVGLLLDMAFAIPGLGAMDMSINISESVKNAKMTYKVFDLIRGSFALRSGNISVVGIPIFYIGILTLASVVVFALNEQIPLRLKVASGVVVVLMHIACSYSLVNETLSVFGTAPLINSSKLICLEAVIFFIAGIGLKNVKSLERGELIAAALIPMFFLIISGVDSAGTTLASTITVATFSAIIYEGVFIYLTAREKFSKPGKYAILAAGFVLVGINAVFVMFNNTIPGSAAVEYFKGAKTADASSGLIFDNTFDLPAIGENDRYIVIPADLSKHDEKNSVLEDINYMSERAAGKPLFEEIFVNIDDLNGFTPVGIDEYSLSDGFNELAISPFTIKPGERLFAYCDAKKGAVLRVEAHVHDSEKVFSGPFLAELDSDLTDFTLRFSIRTEGSDDKCRIAIYKLNEETFNSLKALSGKADASAFKIDNINTDGVKTLILPFAYDETQIRINGEICDSFSYCGKTAVLFDSDANSALNVSLDQNDTRIIPGILISSFAVMCLIAIPVIQRYNVKKKVKPEGTTENA